MDISNDAIFMSCTYENMILRVYPLQYMLDTSNIIYDHFIILVSTVSLMQPIHAEQVYHLRKARKSINFQQYVIWTLDYNLFKVCVRV